MQPDELLAREAIRKTLMVYTMRGDQGRVEDLATAFAEDGVLEIGADHRYVGREAIARGLRESTSEADARFLRHHITSSEISFRSPDEASARTYFFVLTQVGPDHAGVYVDRLRRAGEEWLLAERKVRLDWAADDSVFPREMLRALMRPDDRS
jgi:3-phenylpropionate/cinnamic acid dioxygenase small subunit